MRSRIPSGVRRKTCQAKSTNRSRLCSSPRNCKSARRLATETECEVPSPTRSGPSGWCPGRVSRSIPPGRRVTPGGVARRLQTPDCAFLAACHPGAALRDLPPRFTRPGRQHYFVRFIRSEPLEQPAEYSEAEHAAEYAFARGDAEPVARQTSHNGASHPRPEDESPHDHHQRIERMARPEGEPR